MSQTNQIIDAIVRLVTEQATDDDRMTVKQAFSAGRIAINSGEDATMVGDGFVAIGQDVNDSILVTGRGNIIVYNGVVPSADKLRERLSQGIGIYPPIPRHFIGRDRALKEIKNRLNQENGGPQVRSSIIVHGWPGVGKTTLAAVLAHDPDVEARFSDGVLWMELGQEPDMMNKLASWGNKLGYPSVLKAMTRKEAIAQIKEAVRGRHMLFIVDDVWRMEDAAPFLQLSVPGCAIVFTTRVTKIPLELDFPEKDIYLLPVLEEQDSLRLLEVLAPIAVRDEEEACRALVRDLENLPLALHVAGRLLRIDTKMKMKSPVKELRAELHEREKLMDEEAPFDLMDDNLKLPTVFALLKKSTDLLDAQTRECFAILGSFAHKPASFDLGAMAAVWEKDDPKPTVRSLFEHGLLEPVETGRYQMHALLVSYARSLLAKSDPMKDKFDVFLCHNNEDKPEVKKIGLQLKNHGLHPWLDEWELRPGFPWQPLLEEHIEKIKAVAVFVGPSGIGPWQQMELDAFIREFVKRKCPVIPVILPGLSKKKPQLPIFMASYTWVDFRQDEPDPLDRLIWGITGEKHENRVSPFPGDVP